MNMSFMALSPNPSPRILGEGSVQRLAGIPSEENLSYVYFKTFGKTTMKNNLKWLPAVIAGLSISLGLTFNLAFADDAAPVDPITSSIAQANAAADNLAVQAQNNISAQQQNLSQKLQALSAAMRNTTGSETIIVQQAPVARTNTAAPATTPATAVATPAPAPAITQTTPATGLSPSNPSNGGDQRSQWNYGF